MLDVDRVCALDLLLRVLDRPPLPSGCVGAAVLDELPKLRSGLPLARARPDPRDLEGPLVDCRFLLAHRDQRTIINPLAPGQTLRRGLARLCQRLWSAKGLSRVQPSIPIAWRHD